MEGSAGAPYTAQPLSMSDIRWIIAGIMLAMLLAALDQTIVATALPTIGLDLGDLEHMPWVVTIYLLTSMAVTPLYGKISDIHGRRITLLVGIAAFVIGSFACAVAPTMVVLIAARALQGLGGGGLISLAQTIVADILAPKERARYQVYFASVFVASSLAGPVLGGFLAEHLHWSMIFWINLPLGGLAFWMSHSALRRLPRHDRPHRLDILGALLMMTATVTLMCALSWGGHRFSWTSPQILGLIACSLALWTMFVIRLHAAAEPLIPLAVLQNPVVRAGTLASCFSMGPFIGLTIYVPVYFEAVMRMSASESGFALVPLMVGTVTGATISGRAMAHVEHYKRMPLAGLVISMISSLVVTFFAASLSLPLLELALAAISIGLGTVLPVATVAIQNAVLPHQLGTVTATMNFFRQLGGALVVAVFGAIVLGSATADGSRLTLDTLAGTVSGGAELKSAFQWVFAATFLGFAAGFVSLLAMEEKPLRGTRPGVSDG